MKLQLKRSLKTLTNSTVAQGPSADQMEYGELAVNYVHSDPSLFLKDSTNAIRKLQLSIFPDTSNASSQTGTLDERYLLQTGGSLSGNIEAPSFIGGVARMSTAAPASAEDGELWWNSNDGRLYVYYDDGSTTQWVDASPDSFTLGAGYFDKNESDARYLRLTGGTVGGSIDASSLSISGQSVDTGAQVDAKVATLESSVNTSLAGKADLSGADFTGGLSIAGFVRGGDSNILYIADDISLTAGKSLQLGGANTKLSNDGTAFTVDILSTEMFRVTDSGVNVFSDAIDLNADGSATFGGGDLTINNSGNLLCQRSGSTGFVDLNSTGILKVRGAASGSVLIIEDSSTGSTTASILGDGSASFRDTITSGASDRRGQFKGTCPSSVNASIADAYVAQYNGSSVFSVKYDGSASFAGTVDAAGLTVNGSPVTVDLSAYDTSAEVDAKIAAIPSTDLSSYDTSAEVTAKVAALETSLTDGAPGALNTLNELAAALGDDANFASTVTNSLAGKADLSGATFTSTVTANIFESTGRNEINLADDGTALAVQKGGATVGNLGVEGTTFKIGAIGNSTGSIEFTTKIGSATTPKLTIANSGDATFTGDVNVGGYNGGSSTTNGVLLGSVGGVYSQLEASAAGTGVIFQGMHSTFVTSRITANGAATFNNTVTSPSFYGNGTGDSLVWYGGATGTSSIKADGSGTFAGRVDTGSSTLDNAALVASANHATKGVIQAYHYNNGSVWAAGGADGVTKSEITASGAATFAGGGCEINSAGRIKLSRSTGSNKDGNPVLEVFNEENTKTVEVIQNGSATFAGHVDIGNPSTGSSNSGVKVYSNGAVYNYTDNALGSSKNFKVINTTDAEVIAFGNDGSASFVSGGTTIDGSSGVLVTSSSGAKTQVNGDGFYQIKTDGSTNAATILADGSATFSNYVTSTEGFYVSQTAAPSGGSLFKSWQGSNTYVDILDSGAATFAGNITTGATTYVGNGVVNYASGSVYIQQSNADNTAFAVIHDNYTNPAIQFSGNGTASFAGGSAFDAANSTFATDLVIGDGNGNHGLTIFTDGDSDGILNFARGTTGNDRWRGTIKYDHNDTRFNFVVEYGADGTSNPCAQIGNSFIWTRGSLQARNGYVYLGDEDVADGVISSRESVGILIDSNTTTNETERFFVRTGGSNDLFSVYESGNAYVTGIMQANGYSFSNLQELV